MSPTGQVVRVDSFPTHEHEGIKLRPGRVMPFGATIVEGGVNFSIYSSHATSCKLALFHRGEPEPYAVIPFLDEFRIGHVFAMVVYGLDYEDTEYGYIMDGPNDFAQGHWFDPDKILLDPYAQIISGRDVWGEMPDDGALRPLRSRILQNDFDWQGDRPLQIPMEDLVIYEAHVRGLTAHPSSGVKHPGTFAAVREKIPYLNDLGINAVELLPVYEFDEFENWRMSPDGSTRLLNYWGYSTVGFFAPKAGLAATGHLGMQADELKALVRDLHRNGIEVILDVVFNHTAEGNENGPYISFRGVDNKTYYLLTPDGWYYNFSGCGNTLNCNNPVVRNMILDCLRYWASEYHIDGFRFDLASILGRDQNGAPLENPPLLESLAFDPVLGKCKLIAEAWDAGGMYQVGTFPSWGRWTEWNGKYRDDVRRFLKGDSGVTWRAAQAMQGSPHVYDPQHRGHCASVNFITAHDGFTLMDLFSYNEKQNLANGEGNRDGGNDNHSWDCQLPGATVEQTRALRHQMVKNALSVLLLSHGVPMLLAGDEFGNSQGGNNNAYCQDNEIAWLDWQDLERNGDIFEYTKRLIALRRDHECLRSSRDAGSPTKNGYPRVSIHGVRPWDAEYGGTTFATLFCGDDDFVYIALNMHWQDVDFQLPQLPPGFTWEKSLASAVDADHPSDGQLRVPARSVIVLTSTTQGV
ncbi:glycogen debranching protein [Xylanimonas ulmi]|uniref:Glycogen operon protein n=1 Tax=Xylanimonas ulmi TaxID=228973 RepID=A0A4Q7M3A8_9MICO|nr:alpha-amylase family glycosyl hydrolase [Xylanibacterium ulmi]RZS62004.1 glycogen operon protein [Xylanibacterium ulmi]